VRTRTLGRTEIVVSEIGMGCQSIGGGLYHRDDAQSIRVLHAALDAGVTFFDTADHYSDGRSEALLGEALSGRRDRVVLATKIGTSYTPIGRAAQRLRPLLRPARHWLARQKVAFHRVRAGQKRKDFSPRALVRAVEASLRRLRTDYVDLVQLHKPPLEVLQRGEYLEAFEALRRAGKARHFGVSCDTPSQAAGARLCFERPEIATVQVQANLLESSHREVAAEGARRGVAMIARNPRAQGFLTAAYGDITAETYAASNREEAERAERARRFDFLIRSDRSLAQAALQYLMRDPSFSLVLPRIWNEAGLREILGTLDAPELTSAERAEIDVVRKGL